MANSSNNIDRIVEGKYEIIRCLGEGGMGEVYEARHRLIQRRVALKVLRREYATDEDMAKRFLREAQATTAIGHDHIVEITDMGITDTGELFIAMELLEGTDLRALLAKAGPLPVPRACHIMIQVLSALEAAHAKNIIHRDLKPGNIFLITRYGIADYVKIVDFGISKVISGDVEESKGLTKTGVLLGTPSYMSPEQAVASSNITPAADIFASGVILYEMITGKLPFDGNSIALIFSKVLRENPQDPRNIRPDLPEGLCQVIKKAMDKNPALRFKDAASFRREITPFSPETPKLTGLATTRFSSQAAPLKEEISLSTFSIKPKESLQTKTTKNSWVFAVTFLAIIIVCLTGLLIYQTSKNSKDAEKGYMGAFVAADLEAKDASNLIEVQIEVTPPNTEIIIDDKLQGRGSLKAKFRLDKKSHEIVFRARGYKESIKEVIFDRSMSIVVNLNTESPKILKTENPASSKSSAKDRPVNPNATATDDPAADNESEKKTEHKRVIDEKAPW